MHCGRRTVRRKSGNIRREGLSHRDRRHKAIALAVQRAQKARRPPSLLQRLAQGLHTGFQRLVPDKLVRPQVLEEFLLEDHPIAMRQEMGEHLKHLAPELEWLPRTVQLLALGVRMRDPPIVRFRSRISGS